MVAVVAVVAVVVMFLGDSLLLVVAVALRILGGTDYPYSNNFCGYKKIKLFVKCLVGIGYAFQISTEIFF